MVGLGVIYPGQNIFVLIACHNRRSLTVRAVTALLAASETCGANTNIVVFDDGSRDGTAHAVLDVCPKAQIIRGDGTAFWAKSMSLAEAFVFDRLRPEEDDLLLWLNDDVDLYKDALMRLLQIHEKNPQSVVVGAVCDPESGAMTYSGFRRYGRHALHLSKVIPQLVPVRVDSFNGNVVLIPVSVARKLGGIDGIYSHAWADLDYGFRCQQKSIPMILAPDFVGTCPANLPAPSRSVIAEWKSFLGPKGAGNPISLRRILRLQARSFWLPQFVTTYLLWWARALRRRLIASVEAGHHFRG